MNETECANLIESVKWTEPGSLISLAILEFINVLVIVGNCLVIAAVFCSNKLRSVTNFFIVNLAVADLLVGLAVLPFSATWEVFKVWIFGDLWCRVWLAVDVWMCTASILNLCAISLDRYVAVTRPVTYPSIMSTKKAKSLIAGIWVLSFVICFPPLVGWKDQKTEVGITYNRGNHTLFYATTSSTTTVGTTTTSTTTIETTTNGIILVPSLSSSVIEDEEGSTTVSSSSSSSSSIETTVAEAVTAATVSQLSSSAPSSPSPPCPWKCELTNDRGYVLYSALGSFYIPMFVMLFFYWRIYRAAVRTTRAINQGFKTTKGPESKVGNRFDETRLTLRMHRGRPYNNPQRTPLSMQSTEGSSLSVNSNSNNYDDITGTSIIPKRATSMKLNRQRHEKVSIKVSYPSSENMSEVNPLSYSLVTHTSLSTSGGNVSNGRNNFKTNLYEIGETTFNVDTETKTSHQHDATISKSNNVKGFMESTSLPSSFSLRSKKRAGKRNNKFQVKRFRMETKAAKTLAIIVGGFIFCWMPFFTIYLIRAFCQQCIQPLLFSVLFWLGYCNSAINPVIYALFSNEFRIAFKRILFRCVCTRSAYRASENFQLIAARTCLAPVNFHKTISGVTGVSDNDPDDFS